MKKEENYVIYGKSCDTPIKLRTNDLHLIQLMESLYPKRILPNFILYPLENDETKVELSYYVDSKLSKADEKITINHQENKITCYVESPSYSAREVPFQFLKLLEREWEKENKYCIESAAIGKGKESILLVGPSGSGKTLLALELKIRSYEFLSNENTIIDTEYVYGGTTTVNLKEFVASLFPEILSEVKEVYTVSNVKRYLIEFSPPIYPRKISHIFLIKASLYTEKYEEREVGSEELGFALYEFPTKLIRGVLPPLGRYVDLGKSLDTPTLSRKRVKTFFNLNIPSYYLFGNYKKIADKIEKIL